MFSHDTPTAQVDIDEYIFRWCAQYIAANGLTAQNAEHEAKAKTAFYDRMYANLDSLDTKAGVVMSLNGLVVALYGIVISNKETMQAEYTPSLLIIGFLTSVAAAFSALVVVNVIWSSSKLLSRGTFDLALSDVVLTRSKRTIFHRISIMLVTLSLIIFFIYGLKIMKLIIV